MTAFDNKKIQINLQQLPPELLRKIFIFLSYDGISKMRQVSKFFNKNCQELLNLGFKRVEDYHTRCLQRIKVQLPRRESERRSHPLSRHSDILAAIETRLSLLSMTFNKYIDLGVCCFIPGKVLDEIVSVLRLVDHSKSSGQQPPRPHEVLQELRDISSMAMEYFDDKIAPSLSGRPPLPNFDAKNLQCETSRSYKGHISKHPAEIHSTSITPTINRLAANHITNLQKQLQFTNSSLACYKKELSLLRASHDHVKVKLAQQSRLINQQGKKLEDFNRKLLEYDNRQVEMLAEVKNILQAAGVAVPPLSFNGFLSPSESSKAWKKDGEKHTRKASVTLSDDLESHVNGILEGVEVKLKGTEIRKSSRKRRTPVPYCPSPIGRDELSSNYVLKEESNDDCVETAADKKGKRRRCH